MSVARAHVSNTRVGVRLSTLGASSEASAVVLEVEFARAVVACCGSREGVVMARLLRTAIRMSCRPLPLTCMLRGGGES